MSSTFPGNVSLPARIASKIEVSPSGCWLWTGALIPTGYGHVRWEGKVRRAHRIVYLLVVGMLPHAGLELDHDCNVRRCVNPQHLTPRTHAANVARTSRAVAKCGHPFTREARNGRRGFTARCCWECRKAYQVKKYRERRDSRRAATEEGRMMTTLQSMNYGRIIRLFRNAHGLGLHDLAKKSGVGHSMLSYVENGKRSPSLETLQQICAALDLSMLRLVMLASGSDLMTPAQAEDVKQAQELPPEVKS